MRADKRRKREAIQRATVLMLESEGEPLRLVTVTQRLKETLRSSGGSYKITDKIVAAALRHHPQIHKYRDIRNGSLTMYRLNGSNI